jgi:CBS-domain-containing membrane protein
MFAFDAGDTVELAGLLHWNPAETLEGRKVSLDHPTRSQPRCMSSINARALMTEAPTVIRATAPIREALVVLQSLEVRHLPVVDWGGGLVGVVSDRELGTLSISRILDHDSGDEMPTWLEQQVGSIMRITAHAVGPEADLEHVVRLMVDEKLHAVPVVRSDGILIGLVSYVDLLRLRLSPA